MDHSLVAPYIETLSPYVPGKPIEEVAREHGVPDCAKLASNENPLGASPRALAAIRDALSRVHLYPDGASFALKQKLAERHGVDPAEIVVGAGTNEILTLLARTFLSEGEEVVLSQNTFLVYRLAVQACGRRAVEVPMKAHRYDLEAMARAVGPKTKLVFIANPDNPNGSYVGREELARFLASVPERVIVVLDEAYFEFVDRPDYPDGAELRCGRRGLVVLRTFSKIYGLSGLRVGYALCDRDVAGYLERVRDPFNVSSLAQVAAIAALEDEAHVQATRAVTFAGRTLLERELPRFGFTVVPSVANFVLAEGKDGDRLFSDLLPHGVIVRPMRAYGMPNAVRVSVGTPQENERLLRALEKLQVGGLHAVAQKA
ncbi:MAG: histidinol-phosphate transaminase [Deltaproteobacteria bacterium]